MDIMDIMSNTEPKSEENLFPISNLIKGNKNRALDRSKRLNELNDDLDYQKLKGELNINDNFTAKKSEFKKTLLPKLMATMSEYSPNRQSNAIRLLHSILLHDWKLQDCKLTISALKKQLIPKLISIFEKTNETEVKQTINNLYLFLFFVIGFDNKEVRTLLLLSDNLFINSTIRNLNESNDDISIIKDSLLLLQFYIYYCKKYWTISPILSTLIRFIEHNDNSVVSQSCYTLVIFSQSFVESRKAIIGIEQSVEQKLKIKTNVCKILVDLWTRTDEDQIIKPVFGVITTLLPRFNFYKKKFMDENVDILAIIPALVKSNSDLNKIHSCDAIKYIAMKQICDKKNNSLELIKQMIDRKTICSINDLLESDNSFKVKSSALKAIFVVAYNCTIIELWKLAEQGCLKALCSQLDSDNEQYLKLTLLSLAVFLFEEYKYILKEKKYRTDPKKSLTDFATKIKEYEVIQHLNRFNDKRIEKDRKDTKYKVTDFERIVEEMLFWAYGVETRPDRRQPSMDMMAQRKAFISCLDCKNALADRELFDCEHSQYCEKCASYILWKFYYRGRKLCYKCSVEIPQDSVPWFWFKRTLYSAYIQQQNQIDSLLDPNFIHMKTI